MTTTAIKTPVRPQARRWLISLAVAAMLAAALVGLNAWMESYGEDAAPVWNCYTMGNHQCGPDSPWHGFNVGPID